MSCSVASCEQNCSGKHTSQMPYCNQLATTSTHFLPDFATKKAVANLATIKAVTNRLDFSTIKAITYFAIALTLRAKCFFKYTILAIFIY